MRKVPRGPRWCNCVVWALIRKRRKGGYIAFRESRHVRRIQHAVWSSPAGTHWWGYVPLKPRRGMAAIIHSLGFRGRIERETFGR